METVKINKGLVVIAQHKNNPTYTDKEGVEHDAKNKTSIIITGKGTNYYSALKRGLKEEKESGESILTATERKNAESLKYAVYNRFKKCMFVGQARFDENDYLNVLKSVKLPENWESRVFELMPGCKMESEFKPEKESKPAKSTKKVNPAKNKSKSLTTEQTEVIKTLAEKLIEAGYESKDKIPASSLTKINGIAEKNGFKASDVFKVFSELNSPETESEDLDDLEL